MNEAYFTLTRNENCNQKYIGTLNGGKFDVDIVEANGIYEAIMYDSEIGISYCVDYMPLVDDAGCQHSLEEFVDVVNEKYDEHVDYYLKIIAKYYHDTISLLY